MTFRVLGIIYTLTTCTCVFKLFLDVLVETVINSALPKVLVPKCDPLKLANNM